MTKDNQKRKGNLKYSILLLLLLAILLITSTYAWFTANQVVQVSTLDVHVEAQNGLQISADATNWKTVLLKEDITGATYPGVRNQIPAILNAVSTAGDVTSGFMQMFLGALDSDDDGNQTLTAQAQADGTGNVSTGNYIAFDMYLKVDTQSTIVLTPNSGVTYAGASNRGLQNAARVAFIVEGNSSGEAQASEIQQKYEGTKSIIWEPNYDVHTAAAVTHAEQTYGIHGLQQSGASRLDYDGVFAAINDGIKLEETNADDNPTYFKAVDPDITTPQTNTSDSTFIDLEAGVTKIRVYFWVEGQDVDCENSASGSDMALNMEFKIQE